MGRLVITHSTYVEGLIPLLKRLAEEGGIETVTPAVICRVRGRCVGLRLRISTPITGGFKLLARRGTSAQEVFVVTGWERQKLQDHLDRLLN
jgi:hypothetical protein